MQRDDGVSRCQARHGGASLTSVRDLSDDEARSQARY